VLRHQVKAPIWQPSPISTSMSITLPSPMVTFDPTRTTSGFDDAAFNSVTGKVHVGADDDVVADIQQIVIGNRQCVDEHTFTNAGAVHPQVGGPYW
jgi:hypothetical protein